MPLAEPIVAEHSQSVSEQPALPNWSAPVELERTPKIVMGSLPAVKTQWQNPSLGRKITFGFAISLLIVIVIGMTSYWSIRRLLADGELDSHSRQVLETISDLSGQLKDAETGQRGYVITGHEDYLQPYQQAITKVRASVDSLRRLTGDNAAQQQRLDQLQQIINAKLVELQQVIDLRQTRGFSAAQTEVMTNVGKNLMDRSRLILAEMTRQEDELLVQRVAAHAASAKWAIWIEIIGSIVAISVVMGAGAVIHRDIKARAQAERLAEKLNRQLDAHAVELESTNKELEAFSYSVSHDLRAPLRSISGFSDALRDDCADKLDEQGADYLQRICSATDRMSRLIDDLLNLARVTRAELRKERVNLSAMAQQVMDELRRSDPQRRVQFTAEPNLIAHADARLIRVVFDNLIGNAWKFSSKQTMPCIVFGAGEYEGKPCYYVRDNGAGFDMKFVQKLFGAFQRLHGATEFPGTGVGLATVQRIIRRHGGKVWAEGQPQTGATFYFTL